MPVHAQSRTLCSCKMCIDPLGDHVLTCKQHTGSIRCHNHLMDVVASLSRDSKIDPVRVNHKVSTTGDGTRKQGDVEISNFPISLRDGLVIDVSTHVATQQKTYSINRNAPPDVLAMMPDNFERKITTMQEIVEQHKGNNGTI